LEGVPSLVPGDDVESKVDLKVRSALFFSSLVPAGSRGVVVRAGGDQRHAGMVLVRWPQGRCMIRALDLVKLSGDRPKPLEASPGPGDEERMPKLRLAAGRARGAALALSAMPMFASHFQHRVVDPLVQGAQALPPAPKDDSVLGAQLPAAATPEL